MAKLDNLSFTDRLSQSREQRRTYPNYSTCGRCQLPWAVVTSRDVSYSEKRGMFAICTSCWDELATAEARIPYYVAIARRWRDEDGDDRDVESAVVKSILSESA